MEEQDVRRTLAALLSDSGVQWSEDAGYIRFRARRDGMVWETDCRVMAGQVLLYFRFPFRVTDWEKTRRVCNELNARLVRGALFLPEEGSPVYRCRAGLDDVFLASRRLSAALEYGAAVVVRYWGELEYPA